MQEQNASAVISLTLLTSEHPDYRYRKQLCKNHLTYSTLSSQCTLEVKRL